MNGQNIVSPKIFFETQRVFQNRVNLVSFYQVFLVSLVALGWIFLSPLSEPYIIGLVQGRGA